jgi:hypothetical protein
MYNAAMHPHFVLYQKGLLYSGSTSSHLIVILLLTIIMCLIYPTIYIYIHDSLLSAGRISLLSAVADCSSTGHGSGSTLCAPMPFAKCMRAEITYSDRCANMHIHIRYMDILPYYAQIKTIYSYLYVRAYIHTYMHGCLCMYRVISRIRCLLSLKAPYTRSEMRK